MFRSMKVRHQEFSCRMQSLWYNVMSNYVWYYGESSVSVIRWSWYTAVETILVLSSLP